MLARAGLTAAAAVRTVRTDPSRGFPVVMCASSGGFVCLAAEPARGFVCLVQRSRTEATLGGGARTEVLDRRAGNKKRSRRPRQQCICAFLSCRSCS